MHPNAMHPNATHPDEHPDEHPDAVSLDIIKLQQEVNDYKNKYLRTLADLENTRKRMNKDKEDSVRFAIENVICDFFSPLDNFENALKFANSSSNEVKNWATGFEMILSQFRDVLNNHGIVAFHAEGTMFDPHEHEAMEITETDKHPEGKILAEFAKGYKSQNRTLRAARVNVAKKPNNKTSPNNKENNDE